MRCLFLGEADSEYEDPYGSLRAMLIKYREAINCESQEKNERIKPLITKIEEEPLDSLQQFFLATFQAQSKENHESGYIEKHEVWTDLINFLLKKELNEESDEERKFRKELSVVACYRMYRNLNEWYEHVLINEGLNLDVHWKQQKLPHLKEMNRLSEEELDKEPLSERWRKIVYHDLGPAERPESSEEEQPIFRKKPIFRKSFSEFTTLMKNEEGVFNLRNDTGTRLFEWHGESLDRFLSNELAYLCTDLLHRLESNFDNSKDYLKQWELFRKNEIKDLDDEFIEYQKRTNMLTDFLKNIVKLHENSEGKLKRSERFRQPLFSKQNQLTYEGKRFETFLEVAYLHAVIACQLDDINDLREIFEKWPHPTTSTDDETRISRSNLRTSNSSQVLTYLDTNSSIDFDQFLKGNIDGMSYALLYRWLGKKTPGFYLALASNTCPGKIVGEPKIKRNKGSSLWGNKVILKDGKNYHQIAQGIPNKHRPHIVKKLSSANRYFLSGISQIDQVGDITQSDLMFGATQFTFANINGEPLQSEWEDAFPKTQKWDNTKIERLLQAIWNYHAGGKMKSDFESSLVEKLPLQNLDESTKNDLLEWFQISEEEQIRCKLLHWVHGDEWGGNFTIHNKDQLYAIDLEDVLCKDDGAGKRIIVGGLHAWRFIDKDPQKIPTDYAYTDKIPPEIFNAYFGMGRLLAALVQKTVFEYDIDDEWADEKRKTFIQDSISEIWMFLNRKAEDRSQMKKRKVPFQVWVSFADWLSYWKEKENKLDEDDFITAIDHIKTLATEESTTHDSSPE